MSRLPSENFKKKSYNNLSELFPFENMDIESLTFQTLLQLGASNVDR